MFCNAVLSSVGDQLITAQATVLFWVIHLIIQDCASEYKYVMTYSSLVVNIQYSEFMYAAAVLLVSCLFLILDTAFMCLERSEAGKGYS